MPVLIAIGVSVGVKAAVAAGGWFAHWLIAKHTRRSAIAASVTNVAVAGLNAVPVTLLAPNAAKTTSSK